MLCISPFVITFFKGLPGPPGPKGEEGNLGPKASLPLSITLRTILCKMTIASWEESCFSIAGLLGITLKSYNSTSHSVLRLNLLKYWYTCTIDHMKHYTSSWSNVRHKKLVYLMTGKSRQPIRGETKQDSKVQCYTKGLRFSPDEF